MDNDSYNQMRYNRLKQFYRFLLGFQQLICYPFLNLMWIIFGVGVVLLIKAKSIILENLNVYSILKPFFEGCLLIIVIIFLIMLAIGLIQLIGYCVAIKDEADMNLVFGDRRDIKNQPPILISKRTIKKKGVTVREYFTTCPMQVWQEKKEVICDIMNIHIIGEIEYGGRHNNNGNRIVIKSARGRKQTERGVLYDDTF